jgi:hypothetical protein
MNNRKTKPKKKTAASDDSEARDKVLEKLDKEFEPMTQTIRESTRLTEADFKITVF